MEIAVGISARHVHLSAEDYQRLFGDDAARAIKPLGQGAWASDKKLRLVGSNGQELSARFIGPIRQQTQVEISLSDSWFLGLEAPLRLSGDLEASASITLTSDTANINVPGLIIAQRHLHINQEDAAKYQLHEGQVVAAEFAGDRAITFKNVKVRISEDTPEPILHLDTDEGNAAGLDQQSRGTLIF